MAKEKEEIVAGATKVFLRYGYKRVTMSDLAEAVGMSRPALYLVFPSKEEIFTAGVERIFVALLEEVRQGLSGRSTVEEKLKFAFDVWCVRPFEMTQSSPDAKDLYESTHEFAGDVTAKGFAAFIKIVAEILEPLVSKQTKVSLSATQIAQILTNAVPGFKASVENAAQLREMIAGLITIVIAGIQRPARKPL